MTIQGRILADGQLGTTEADLYTASGITYIKSIICSCVSSGVYNVYLYGRFDGINSRQFLAVPLEQNETLLFDDAFVLENGDSIRGKASAANGVDYIICGGE